MEWGLFVPLTFIVSFAAAHGQNPTRSYVLLSYLNAVYTSSADAATIEGFITRSVQHMDSVKSFILNELPALLPSSGFIEGSVPGEADFHVAAWIARIALICGAGKTEEGTAALEKELGQDVPEKVVAYWNAWAARESWKEVYANGLH